MNNLVRVLIFGLSYHGRAVYRFLDRNLYDVVGFLDNDIEKSGKIFGDVKIHHVKNINLVDFDVIIVAGRNIDEMIRQLVGKLFISEENIMIMNRSDLSVKGNALNSRERVLVDMLLNFTSLVKERGIKYWVTKSSLLALKRGEYFAKFSDVDICIMSEQIPLFVDSIDKYFSSYDIKIEKYDTSSKYWEKGDVSSIEIFEKIDPVIAEPALIDISVLNKYNDSIFIKSLYDTLTILPFYFFDGHSIINYHNMDFSVPKNTEEYLRLTYGDDWSIPAERWQHKHYKSVKWN